MVPARDSATVLASATPSTATARTKEHRQNMTDKQTPRNSALRALFDDYKAGRVTRRQFTERAAMSALGIGGAAFLANAGGASAKPLGGFAFAQNATPAAGGGRPEVGTENQERGSGGDLRLIQWQAPSLLSPHVAVGVKDFLAACIVVEPLMHYLPDATLTPNLVKEVPSVENGLLAEDLTSVTYNLLEGVTWSDGEPFTADDVVFTWQWVMDEANGSVNFQSFVPIEKIEAVDPVTAKVTFKAPNPNWFEAHAGTSTGYVYPKHILDGGGKEANDAFALKPIGTGPYVVDSFSPNDSVTYLPNENYREPNKPFFGRVLLKGGGDAASAARAVIQTGEYDFAWNLQVEPAIIEDMMKGDNTYGVAKVTPGANVERINFNFSDPNKEVDGQKSELNTPHPFLTDDAVRKAIDTAVNRDQIANEFYGEGNPPAKNILSGIPALESPNTSYTFDTEAAKKILDDAGWTGDGTRSKDGVELKVTYATSVNQVRQKTQAVVKKNLEDIGFEVTLEQIDAGIYFDSAAGNDQNISHFYWDFDMYQSVPSNPTPISYMEGWYAGKDNDNVAQKSNEWQGQNYSRWINPDFDKLLDSARTEPDPEKLADLFIQMNDMLIDNNVILPLVVVGSRTGIGNRLREENLALGAFSYNYWNIANWNLAEGQEPA
jgi:peptide/nickel transport system substrate-binding protein